MSKKTLTPENEKILDALVEGMTQLAGGSFDSDLKLGTNSEAAETLNFLFRSTSEELKRIVDELSSARAFFEAIFQATSDLLIVFQADGKIDMLNAPLAKSLAIDPNQSIGQNLLDVIELEVSRNNINLSDITHLRHHIDAKDVSDIPGKLIRKNQSHLPVLITGVAIDVHDKLHYILSLKNAEDSALYKELKEKQLQLVQSDKLSSIGTMVAGIAHELNNPMMGILNYIQYALKTIDPKHEVCEYLKSAENEVIRCNNIVGGLLTYSRAGKIEDEDNSQINLLVMVNRCLSTLSFLTSSLGVAVKVEDSLEIEATLKPMALQQVIFNVIKNAIEATKGCDPKAIQLALVSHNGGVAIEVLDTGSGADQDVQKQMFDPFFTTKDQGEGTGLGLSISHTLMRDMGGNLLFENRSDGQQGGRMLVVLPKQEGQSDG